MSFVPFNVSNVFNEFNVLQSREVIDKHVPPHASARVSHASARVNEAQGGRVYFVAVSPSMKR